MRKFALLIAAGFALGACGNTLDIYPESAADCPTGSVYKTNPPWLDDNPGNNARPGFRWCEKTS